MALLCHKLSKMSSYLGKTSQKAFSVFFFSLFFFNCVSLQTFIYPHKFPLVDRLCFTGNELLSFRFLNRNKQNTILIIIVNNNKKNIFIFFFFLFNHFIDVYFLRILVFLLFFF